MAAPTHRSTRLSRDEALGIVIAVVAHVAIVLWMALEPPGKPVVVPPERMTVSFADDVSLQSTSPEPMAQAAPDVAPERGEMAPEPQELAPPEPEPAPRPEPARKPVPRPVAKPVPKVAPNPAPKPVPKLAPKAAPKPAAKAAATDDRPRRRPDAPAGASRIGSDFLKGVPGAQAASGTARSAPGAASGPSSASLSQAIARQLKPHWVAPQGADAEKLVTVLAWELRPDGSLAGRPRVVSQSGITPANEAQKARHAEQAIRAVQLAAPFDLPDQFYSSWRRVSAFRFDRKLSQ